MKLLPLQGALMVCCSYPGCCPGLGASALSERVGEIIHFSPLSGKILVDFLISLITAHLTDGVLQHGVLLVEVVHSLFALGVVVHWRLEEEAQEALGAVTAGTGSKVAQQSRGRAAMELQG